MEEFSDSVFFITVMINYILTTFQPFFKIVVKTIGKISLKHSIKELPNLQEETGP